MEAGEYGVVILLLETKNYFSKISLFHSVLIAGTDTNLICLSAKPQLETNIYAPHVGITNRRHCS